MWSIQNKTPCDINKFTYVIMSFILNTPGMVFKNSKIQTRWTGPRFHMKITYIEIYYCIFQYNSIMFCSARIHWFFSWENHFFSWAQRILSIFWGISFSIIFFQRMKENFSITYIRTYFWQLNHRQKRIVFWEWIMQHHYSVSNFSLNLFLPYAKCMNFNAKSINPDKKKF